MTKRVAPNDVIWQCQPVIKMHDDPPTESQWRYSIWIPDWLAKWDVFANWEKERFLSMEEHLKNGDVLFDIGTEVGWCNIIYAQFVGPENVVLVEPTGEFWPNIKATWERNFGRERPPLGCFYGLFSDKNTSNFILPKGLFPAEADGELIDKLAYRYIHEHGRRMPQITLDSYVEQSGNVPAALTIDTEGAELLIIKGAKRTLKKHNVKVWISVHPELAARDYGVEPNQLKKFLERLGYKGELLATDHEEHWLYRKAAK